MSVEPIEILAHARALAGRYRVWLCDVWGVVHNGVAAFPCAVDALSRFRAAGGTVILITNAPRPSSVVLGQLARLGVQRDAFDAVVTSGDTAREWMERLGQRPACHIGPERDRSLFDDLDLNLTEPERAEVALCTGLFDDTRESANDYRDLLGALAARGVDMLCANPDLVVDRGGVLVPCAGALGKAYEAIGGRVIYAGKPYRPIYDVAIERAGAIAKRAIATDELLAIGDGLGTDIAGAAAMGIDALFVIGGIHMGDIGTANGDIDAERLAALFASQPRRPIAAQKALVW